MTRLIPAPRSDSTYLAKKRKRTTALLKRAVAKKRSSPEMEFQIALVRDLKRILPEDAFLTAFPAGGGGIIRGAQLKRAGLVPGFPDLLLIHRGYCFGLELKSRKGVLSEAQAETHRKLSRAGVDVRVVRNLDEALTALKDWAIPTRIVGDWLVRRDFAIRQKERAA